MENIDYLDFLVEKGILRIHHKAMERGYCWRTVPPELEVYHGRFGHGYKVHSATRRSTMYHPITYYIWFCGLERVSIFLSTPNYNHVLKIYIK